MNYIFNIEKAISLYNDCFGLFLVFVIGGFIIIGIMLYIKMKNEDNLKWYSFLCVIKKKLFEMVCFVSMVWILIVFLNDSFSIDILRLLNARKYWKIIFSVWVVGNVCSGKRLYDWLNYTDFLDKVKDGKYPYRSPEKIMLDMLDRYNAKYLLQTERLGILKSLTPICLMPLIAGYVLEGKNVNVDWNWYTVAFFAILFFYFFNVWKCYKNMQFLKERLIEIQKKLRDI